MNVYRFTILALLISTILCSCKDDDEVQPPTEDTAIEGYTLSWSDEFNENSINALNWVYENGDGTDYGLPKGWGNNESQVYTENTENSGIEQDGDLSTLYIKAVDNGGDYTSAKLTTNKLFSMRFGRIDVKAKLPQGKGLWPAIWMLGDNKSEIDWPGCGEIDIVECIGNEPNKIFQTVHYTNAENQHAENQGEFVLNSGTFNDDYHVFRVDWTPENLTYYVDDVETHKVAIDADMKEFLRSFYLVLNVAVGGNWPGSPDNTTSFPQSMNVDFIRVYTKNGFVAPNPPALVVEEEQIGQNLDAGIVKHILKDGFDYLGSAEFIAYGSGGEPIITTNSTAIDGDSSIALNYPGGGWGGGYIELSDPKSCSGFTHLVFALNAPSNFTDGEVKIESPSTNAAVFLKNYTGTPVDKGFVEYKIPFTDFGGLDLTKVKIPFSLWNPKDDADAFLNGEVLVDNVHLVN